MASMVLWKERKKNAKRGFAAELMTEAGSRTGKKKSNRKLGASVRFLAEMRSLETLAD